MRSRPWSDSDRRGCCCCDGRDCCTTASGRTVHPSLGHSVAVRRRILRRSRREHCHPAHRRARACVARARASSRLGRSPRAVDVGCPGTLAVFRNDPRSGRRRERSSAHGHPDGPVVLPVRGRRGLRSSIAGRWFRRCSHRRDLVRGAARLGGGAGRGPRRGDSAHGCAAASGRRWVLSSASRWRRGWSRGDARRRMRSRRRARLQADASRHERVYERQPKRGCAETRGRTSLSLQSDRVPVAGGNQ